MRYKGRALPQQLLIVIILIGKPAHVLSMTMCHALTFQFQRSHTKCESTLN